MMAVDHENHVRIASGRETDALAETIGHFNTQDLVQLTSPDQGIDEENQFYQETE
jgi:hypothetical protein